MLENQITVIITLSDSQSKDEDLQEAVQNLQLELREVEGVSEANLIAIKQAAPDAKGIGGFLVDQLKAVVNLKNFKTVVGVLNNNLFGRTIKIKAEGNGKIIKLELKHPEDINIIIPKLNEFINN